MTQAVSPTVSATLKHTLRLACGSHVPPPVSQHLCGSPLASQDGQRQLLLHIQCWVHSLHSAVGQRCHVGLASLVATGREEGDGESWEERSQM